MSASPHVPLPDQDVVHDANKDMGPPPPGDQKARMATTAKKEQGCFQCSRRRIICDKNEPSCTKCIKKGIECSGLGRIRFAEGVARRGRLKDCKIPVIDGLQEGSTVLLTHGPSQTLTWPEDRKPAKRKRRGECQNVAIPWQKELAVLPHTPVGDELGKPAVGSSTSQTLVVQRGTWDEKDTIVEEIIRSDIGQHARRRNDPHRWLPPVDSTARMLFSYCKSSPVNQQSMC
jgi:hypothetical protein